MRRLNFLLLVLLLSIFKAQYSYSNVTIDGIVYSIDDASETATVKKQHWVMPSGGYYYVNYSTEKVYDRYSGDIHIPATVEIDDKKYKVEIGESAFYNSINITSVSIDEGITAIPEEAFAGCLNMKSIFLPTSLESIASGAFSRCTSLETLHIPENVSSIGGSILAGSSNVSAITVAATNQYYDSRDNCNAIMSKGNTLLAGCKNTIIPNNTVRIGTGAFDGCTGLTEIIIPESVAKIEDFAFSGCSGISELIIPKSVTNIGWAAFKDCIRLKKVEFSEGLTVIADLSFSGCESLQSISIPSTVQELGVSAFVDCSSLSNIDVSADNPFYDSRNNCNAIIKTSSNKVIIGCSSTIIPESVSSIGAYAFKGSGIENLTIPTSVTNIEINNYIIESTPFSGCRELSSIVVADNNPVYDSRDKCNAIIHTSSNKLVAGCASTHIPADVETVGQYAFLEIENLKGIEFPEGLKTIEYLSFCKSGLSGNVAFPSTVETIDDCAFLDNKELVSVTFPEKLEYLGWASFFECNGLKKCVFLGSTPPENGEFSNEIYVPHIIKIPVGSLSAYKNSLYMDYYFSNPSYYEEISTTSVLPNKEDENVESIYYDLFGRRVENPQSGLYIKDGKKIFVK